MITEFVCVRVLYNPRICNSVADKRAKIGVELGPSGVLLWPDEVSAIVSDLVATDLGSANS